MLPGCEGSTSTMRMSIGFIWYDWLQVARAAQAAALAADITSVAASKFQFARKLPGAISGAWFLLAALLGDYFEWAAGKLPQAISGTWLLLATR